MGFDWYRHLWPVVRRLPVELAHDLGMLALRAPWPLGPRAPLDPFEWRGHSFRNRVGIAAGFDKNAAVLPGLERLGVGFVEVGTVVTRPWPGHPGPRMTRLPGEQAIWNRLGFPSVGAERVVRRLRSLASRCPELTIGCNVAPHPLTVRCSDTAPDFLARAQAELRELADLLHAHASFFVLNLSSPNTAGLRRLLYGPTFAGELVAPLRERLSALDRAGRRPLPTLLLVKLPPEDAEGRPWEAETLGAVVTPLRDPSVCDGFVAVNTSVELALEREPLATADRPGGLSGAPLLPLARNTLGLLREIAAPEQLRIGVGGVLEPQDAVALVDAGAHLVELLSGLIYRGPGLVARCVRELAHQRPATGRSREPSERATAGSGG